MNDHDFFDLLFQQFAKTTNAESAYWMNEEDGQAFGNPLFSVYAVDQEQEKVLVAKWMSEADADFVTAVAGCFPDLVRRLHAALDEADRADREHDEREQQIGRLALENMELRQINEVNASNRSMADTALEAAAHWKAELQVANDVIATLRSKAADALWKIERPM